MRNARLNIWQYNGIYLIGVSLPLNSIVSFKSFAPKQRLLHRWESLPMNLQASTIFTIKKAGKI